MFVSKSIGSPFINQPKDINFANTVLLLHGDGVVNANNTMFIDSSGANTFIPFNGTSSYYFNGSTDYLTLTPNTVIGTNDFNIEAWIYLTGGATTNPTIFCSGQFWFVCDTNALYLVQAGVATVIQYTSIPSSILNTWTHVAASRQGTNLRLFVNGAVVNTVTNSTNFVMGSGATRIGIESTSLIQPFFGYISNLRVVNGVAVYTSNFTPPSSELPYVNGTQILTAQNPTSAQTPSIKQPLFKDNSPSNPTFTTSGTPAISTGGPAIVLGGGKPAQGTFSPFSQTGWSNYFNGSSDYISTPSPGTTYQFGTGNWTIEAWVYTSSTSTIQTVFQIYGTTVDNLNIQFNGTTRAFFTDIRGTNQTAVTATSTVLANLNQWNHVVLTRDSTTTIKLYVNGVLGATQAIASTTTFVDTQFSGNPTIGAKTNAVTNYWAGYISNLRVVKGTAVYTDNFTPPTTPLTAIANTILLTCQSNRFIDNSTSNFSLTTNGTPPSIQPFSPFVPSAAYSKNKVGSSILFNASSDYIQSGQYLQSFNPGSNNFTMECWAYITAGGNRDDLIQFAAATGNNRYGLVFQTTGNLDYISGVGSPATSLISVSITDAAFMNRWNHIAVSRNSGTSRLYLNGALIGNTADTSTWTDPLRFTSGKDPAGSTYVAGYVSNIRLLNGTGLYPAAFTPPTTPLQPIGNTVLLINSSDGGIIDQTGRYNFATYGGSSISTTQSKFGRSSMFFNGTTDYLSHTYSITGLNFDWATTGSYTIEGWIYPTSFANYKPIISNSAIGGGNNWELVLNSAGNVVWRYWTGTAQIYQTTSAVTLNTWNHVALVLNNSVITIYINGVAGVSSAYVATAAASAGVAGAFIYIGAAYGGITGAATNYFAGYVDEMRITRSARYTANFNPPARKFEDR
jgi:hypothetical protein